MGDVAVKYGQILHDNKMTSFRVCSSSTERQVIAGFGKRKRSQVVWLPIEEPKQKNFWFISHEHTSDVIAGVRSIH